MGVSSWAIVFLSFHFSTVSDRLLNQFGLELFTIIFFNFVTFRSHICRRDRFRILLDVNNTLLRLRAITNVVLEFWIWSGNFLSTVYMGNFLRVQSVYRCPCRFMREFSFVSSMDFSVSSGNV